MIACGVDIKGKEAILALVQSGSEESRHIKNDVKRLSLKDDRDASSLAAMLSTIEAFASQNNVDIFVIKARQTTGQRAGGGVTFKIETLVQLSGTPTTFISAPTLAKFAKGNLGGVPNTVLAYQTDAYRAGSWHLSQA